MPTRNTFWDWKLELARASWGLLTPSSTQAGIVFLFTDEQLRLKGVALVLSLRVPLHLGDVVIHLQPLEVTLLVGGICLTIPAYECELTN